MSEMNKLPVYEGMSYPAHLKPKTTLYKMGLRPVDGPVAITRKNSKQEYSLYNLFTAENLILETATSKELKFWMMGLEERLDDLTEEEQRVLNSKKATKSKRKTKDKKEKQSKDASFKASLKTANPLGIKLSSYTYKSHRKIIERQVDNLVVETLNLKTYDLSTRPSSLLTPRELLGQDYTFNGSVLGVMDWGDGVREYLYTYQPKTKVNWKTLLDSALLNPSEYVILDTETTGIEYDDEVIQLTCLDVAGNVLYDGYFNPTKTSHWAAAKKHKLSKYFLAKQPEWRDEWSKISSLLQGKTILAHNSDFDQRLIQQTCQRYELEPNLDLTFICTMPFVKALTGENALEKALNALNYTTGDANLHNARTDCFMLLKVLLPKQEVFKTQEEAEIIFERVCRYKTEVLGESDAETKGWGWILSTNPTNSACKDFKVLDLKTCRFIITSLESTVHKLNTVNFK